MHGLINRAVESFARETYGDAFWDDLTKAAELGFGAFEAMLLYDPALTLRVIDEMSASLNKPKSDLLEDIGTFLVTAPSADGIRRLLRFSGTSFMDFLYALDDMPARVQLAVPELMMPSLELKEHAPNQFSLMVGAPNGQGRLFGHVMIGLLRAMADDYGALVFLEHKGGSGDTEMIGITLLEAAFSEARDFNLGARAG